MTNPAPSSKQDHALHSKTTRLRQVLRSPCGIVLLALLLVLLVSVLIIHFLPKRYQAVAVVIDGLARLTEAYATNDVRLDGPKGGQPEGFVPSPSEALASDEVIEKLVQELDLASRFKLPDGPALIDRLRGMIQIKPIPGTDAVRIVVTDVDQQRAPDIARGIDKAYRVAQQPRADQLYFHACEVLDTQIKSQEERTQAARMKMEMAMENTVFVDISRSAARHKELEDDQLRSIHFADFKSALEDYEDQKDILAFRKTEREKQLSSLILPRFHLLFWEETRSLSLLNPSHVHQLFGALTGLILGAGLVLLAANKFTLGDIT